jgi:hypothetical protein
MYVVPCHLPHSVVVCIMSFLLMITRENVGYISLNLKVTHLINSNSIKPLLKRRQGNTSKPLEQTMEESLKLSSLRIFASRPGIKRQMTVPYNPQQNRVVESQNKTICEAAKAMIFYQDLPNSLWAEAISTAVYIQNKCPHAILKDKTLEEVFSGIKPEVRNLRIFGCLVYIHVPKKKRTKMEPSSKKGVFVGYYENSKAYRIYVPSQRQIEVSRDVTFHEEVAFKKSRELQQELEVVQPASTSSKKEESDDQREEPHEGPSDKSLKPAEELERTLEEPPAKRKPGWLKQTL